MERVGATAGSMYETLWDLGCLYLGHNDSVAARSLFERAIGALAKERGENNSSVVFHRACSSALLGDRDQAISYLRRAFELGYIAPDAYARNFNLVSLREDPEFQALVAEVRKRFDQEWTANQ